MKIQAINNINRRINFGEVDEYFYKPESKISDKEKIDQIYDMLCEIKSNQEKGLIALSQNQKNIFKANNAAAQLLAATSAPSRVSGEIALNNINELYKGTKLSIFS